MRSFDAIWMQYHNNYNGNWRYESYIEIDGNQIPSENIIKKSWSGGATLTGFDLGLAPSQSFTLVFNSDSFATSQNQKVVVKIRANGDLGSTPYYNFGTYFTDKVIRDGRKYRCECLDCMKFLEGNSAEINNMSMVAAVNVFADIMGCTTDTSNIRFDIDDTDLSAYSNREILGFIASANGGNFIVDFDNVLRLIRLQLDIPTETITESNAIKLRKNEESKRLTGVTLVKSKGNGDDGNIEFSSLGGESVLKLFNPLATQEISDALLAQLSAYDYTPCEVTNAYINPAVEIGDTVTVKGRLTQIWNWNISQNLIVSFSAPSNLDIYNEFKGTLTAELERIRAEKITQIVNVIENEVLVSDTAQILNCWIKNLTVEFFETNFVALDVRQPQPINSTRNYIRIYNQTLQFLTSSLSETETENYTTPDGDQIFWTAIDDELQAYKYFTITDPVKVHPSGSGLTDEQKEEVRESFRVKVRKQLSIVPRLEISFDETHPANIPKMKWGIGNEQGNGKGYTYKETDAMYFTYTLRQQREGIPAGTEIGIKIDDNGVWFFNISTGAWELISAGSSSGSQHIVLDHLPTSSEIEDIPLDALVLVYDPNTPYIPEG